MLNTLAILGAALSFGPAHGNFTLSQARAVDAHYEQHLSGNVGACSWRNHHDAVCVVVYRNVTPIDGQPSENLRALDLVTRSGPCSTHVTRRTSSTSGIAHGSGHHNCFTGPLLALPIKNSIHQTD